MQARDFAFWLQGFFELSPPGPITAEQAALIKTHLDLVFQHDIARKQLEHAPAPNIVDIYKDMINEKTPPISMPIQIC